MTRSERNTGSCRAHRGSGPVGRASKTWRDRREEGEIVMRGRGSGPRFAKRLAAHRRHCDIIDAKRDPDSRHAYPVAPHPTKSGPGRA